MPGLISWNVGHEGEQGKRLRVICKEGGCGGGPWVEKQAEITNKAGCTQGTGHSPYGLFVNLERISENYQSCKCIQTSPPQVEPMPVAKKEQLLFFSSLLAS